MAPYTPSIPRARGTRGARNEPSSAHDRGAGEGRGSRGVDVKLGQELATRETEKERVIVIDSDSDSDSDDSDDDGAGSSPEPAPPSLPHSSLGSSARTVEVGDRTTRATAVRTTFISRLLFFSFHLTFPFSFLALLFLLYRGRYKMRN